MQDFLRTRLRRHLGGSIEKEKVVQIVRELYDVNATLSLIGRGVSKAFGKKTHSSAIKT